MRNAPYMQKALNADALAPLYAAARNWQEYLDSDGDGSDVSFEDEAKMLQALRDALNLADGGKRKIPSWQK